MRAMVFEPGSPVLHERALPDPVAGPGELLIDVHACGVCRTDLHVVDGELAHPRVPLVAPPYDPGAAPRPSWALPR